MDLVGSSVGQNEQKYKKRDDASARLGEKMLQGWTLLGITCPNDGCFTPFVRNKQGKMYCVNCDQYAVTEEDAKKEREQREQQQVQQRDEELAAQLAQEQQEREQRIAQRFRDEEQRKAAQQERQEQARVAAATATTATSLQTNAPVKRKSDNVPLDASADSDRVKALRHQTLAALYQKMEDLTDSLSANDHSERMVTVAKTIRELAEAIKTLSSDP